MKLNIENSDKNPAPKKWSKSKVTYISVQRGSVCIPRLFRTGSCRTKSSLEVLFVCMCELGRSRPEIDFVRTPQYDLKMEWITINALSMLGALT